MYWKTALGMLLLVPGFAFSATATRAEVTALTLGIHVNCPYGLAG
jgi:hypothetical protein